MSRFSHDLPLTGGGCAGARSRDREQAYFTKSWSIPYLQVNIMISITMDFFHTQIAMIQAAQILEALRNK